MVESIRTALSCVELPEVGASRSSPRQFRVLTVLSRFASAFAGIAPSSVTGGLTLSSRDLPTPAFTQHSGVSAACPRSPSNADILHDHCPVPPFVPHDHDDGGPDVRVNRDRVGRVAAPVVAVAARVALAVLAPSVAGLVAEVEASGIEPGSNWSWSMGNTAHTLWCDDRGRDRMHLRGERSRVQRVLRIANPGFGCA